MKNHVKTGGNNEALFSYFVQQTIMKKLIILFLLFYNLILSAQVNERDSLFKLLSNSSEDTGKVVLLLKVADLYETNNQDSSLYYLEIAKQLSEKLDYKKGLLTYSIQKGIVLFTIGDYKASMEQHKLALELAEKLKDSAKIINILANTGTVYQYMGKYDQQLDVTLKALALIEHFKISKKISSAYHNIGNTYFNLKQYIKSIEYCKMAVVANSKYGGNLYMNRVYATLGQNFDQLKQYDSALYNYNIAVSISLKQNDIYAEASLYGYLCNVYAGLQQYGAMLEEAEKSLKLSKKLQSRQLEALSLYNLAYALYFNNSISEAKTTIYKAIDIAEKDSLIDELKNSYIILTFIAASEKDYKTLLLAKSKTDSLELIQINKEVISASMEYQEKYESEKKVNQIKLQQIQLKHKKFLIFMLLGGIFWITLISILIYRNLKHRQKIQKQKIVELETEKQLTATEAVLKGEEQERTRLAKDLHDGLGGILSGLKYSFITMKGNLIMTPDNQQAFERGMDMLDSSIKEMRRVAHNMMPEALVRFGLDTALRDFCNDINQSGALTISYQSFGMDDVQLDQTVSVNLYRIIQELLNNTLKHAQAQQAIVQLMQNNNLLTITVEDNGKGFDTSILKERRGIGWTNIQNRVDFLKGKLDINSKPGEGTSVQIELKITI